MSVTRKHFTTNHAGLVLLWPFMPMFFKSLGIDVGFEKESDRQKAVQLLLYTADKTDDYTEHDANAVGLMFSLDIGTFKVLAPLSAEEKTSTEHMLLALMAQWKPLQKSTTETLRDTFLQRKGTLSVFSDKLELNVEPNTFDVLLSNVPWTMSFVHLPWMKKVLWIKWR